MSDLDNGCYEIRFTPLTVGTFCLKVRPDGNTPVTLAVEAGNSEAVAVFLEGECSNFINIPNKQGESQIHFAARSGDRGTMEMLLDKGAEINRKNANNQTALFLAASSETTKRGNMDECENNENLEIVEMLIKR